MTTQLKVNRKDFIDKLKSIKEDNIQIANVLINRSKLIEALRLQNQDDMLTLTYGRISYHDVKFYNHTSVGEYTIDNEPCMQFSCNHTVMRFLNRATVKNGEPKVIPLNFVDHYDLTTTKTELTGIPLDTLELIDALTFVIHGVATDGTRPVLGCVCFDCQSDSITLVTADGFRLSTAKMTAKGIGTHKVLIHCQDIPKLLTFLKSNYTGKGKAKTWLDTYIDIRESQTQFISEKGKLEFDNQTGSYPDYSKLIPNTGTHIQVVASEMLEAVKALNTIAKDGSGIIRLKFSKYPDKLTLSARSEDLGDSSVECQALVDKECKIAINAKYLVDFLSVCKDNIIDLFITHYTSPMVCHNGADQLEVIMPMYVQW